MHGPMVSQVKAMPYAPCATIPKGMTPLRRTWGRTYLGLGVLSALCLGATATYAQNLAPPLWIARVLVLDGQGQYEDAVDLAQRCLARDPHCLPCLFAKAHSEQMLLRYSDAERDFTRLLAEPNAPAQHAERARQALQEITKISGQIQVASGATAPLPKPGPPPTAAAPPGPAPAGWALVPAGLYTVGAPKDEYGYSAAESRGVTTIDHAFVVQKAELTQAAWVAVMKVNPSVFKACGPSCPVDSVSWYDTLEFLNRWSVADGLQPCYALGSCSGTPGGGCSGGERSCLGEFTCLSVNTLGPTCSGYRLPTELEWEVAARAGVEAALPSGPMEVKGIANSPSVDALGWYAGNSGIAYGGVGRWCRDFAQTQRMSTWCGSHPVGEKAANGYGLVDVIGNVWEWTESPVQPIAWMTPGLGHPAPTKGDEPEARIIRGGGSTSSVHRTRLATRFTAAERLRRYAIGFRPVRTVQHRSWPVDKAPASPSDDKTGVNTKQLAALWPSRLRELTAMQGAESANTVREGLQALVQQGYDGAWAGLVDLARQVGYKKAFCEASLQYLTHFPKARDAEPLSAERVSSCGQDPADPAGHALDSQKAAALINATASKLQACYMENEGRDGVALLLRPRVAIGATGVVHDVLWGAPRTDENYKNLLACCDLVVYALRFPMSQQGGVVQTPITLGY